MTPTPYTEDTLVQQTTADYLEQELGWESVFAHNREDFGPGSLLGRASDREVVLERTLRAKLAELNPCLPDSAYEDAVRQITAVSASQTLVAANREKYKLVRDGVQVVFTNDRGQRETRRLRLFDFDEPDNNHFLCVRELWVRGDLYRRRARHRRFRQRPAAAVHRVQEHPPRPQGRLRGELLRLPRHHPPPVPPQRSGDVRQRRESEDRLDHQPLGALPRVEAPGRGRAGRGRHGDAAKGGLRQAQLPGPGGELHPLRRIPRARRGRSWPATTSSSA